MYEFLRLQYIMHKITAEQVRSFAPRWITEAQATEILRGAAT